MSNIIKKNDVSNYDVQTAQGQLERVYGSAVQVSGQGGTQGVGVNSGVVFTVPVAAKNDQAKADLSLIPQVLFIETARAFMVGEKKYGRYNYTKGHNASQLVAAALRHLTAWNDGEEHDPTDGQHHLGAVGACIAMILRQQELGTLKDNRFKKGE